MVFDTI